jgi:hypothetical protein
MTSSMIEIDGQLTQQIDLGMGKEKHIFVPIFHP